ncbi:uncharacterized protein LOC119733878 [Patiria miniata]|uniref:SAP domain-containing protein n=1 Tax=Patiria miniata TaxID=46514 RepID=A0A914AGQ7_PATMI|nr:uncharacterized protein LOC119733878 [Patiria miniata]
MQGAARAYGSMTIALLKEELRRRNAKTSGRKKELVERLECYDRNFNFGQGCDLEESEEVYTFSMPNLSTYKDVNRDSQIPHVTNDTLKAFIQQFGKSEDGKPEAMYRDRLLLSLRHSSEGDHIYIAARVAAEMKKKLVYKVDVKLDKNTREYHDHFRNVWINSQAKDLPIRQLYAPANIFAVTHDHDYLELTHEEYFLKSLNVTNITENDLEQVEEATRGQSTNKFWKEERRKRLHASNFGRICKSGVRTDFEKMARSLTTISEFSSKPTDHGLKYESVAVEAYSSKTGNLVKSCGIHVCMEIPYLACSPDGLVDDDRIIEVKCPYTCKDSAVTPTSVPYLFMDSSGKMALKHSHNYYYQVQGNLLCTKRKWCDFVVWTTKDMKIMHIPRDDEFINELKIRLRDFFEQFFKAALLETFLYRVTDKYDFSQDKGKRKHHRKEVLVS